MLLQTQLHCGVMARFLICLCLVRFAAAKCVPEKCGDFEVSYPFWINNPDCGLSYPNFQITCRKNKHTGMLAPFLKGFVGNDNKFLRRHYYRITEIDYKGHLIMDSSSIKAVSCDPRSIARQYFGLSTDSPFTLSNSNRLVVLGCGTFGTYSYVETGWDWVLDENLGDARCVSVCKPRTDQPYCPDGCCELILPENWPWINFTAGVSPHRNNKKCAVSIIMDPSTFWGEGRKASYGLRLNWGTGLQNCSAAKATADYSCSIHAECNDSPSGYGHICKCLLGYEGNGYFNGTDCTDINECRNKWTSGCVAAEEGGICHNLAGSYNCSCAKGYVGDGFRNGTGCMSTNVNRLVFPVIIGSVSSFLVVCLAASLLVWWLKKRHLKLVEAKYYQQLQQHIASAVGRESLRIFSAKELARASNNYSKEMVLGSGGFGTVFKGNTSDGFFVAIKKSKQALNVEDDHEFLNEATILSQINHRNIVKLLGCCIQTKFPLLVSEFVPNGTLFEHLHSREGSLSWASRLQIAIETGEALAYLHSGASQPIFHLDVKSSNILLTESLSPKVADFGISRLISASNNTHVTTYNIKGTRGYLDPEYFQTFQLTEKSDVYSFGVVLLELLTALKPISMERNSDEMSLSSLFLSRLDHNRVTEILDNRILEEENLQQMEDMAKIARQCLHLERRKRPSMKELVEELVWVRSGTRRTKFCDSGDVIFEDTSAFREASQTSYTAESTSEERSLH